MAEGGDDQGLSAEIANGDRGSVGFGKSAFGGGCKDTPGEEGGAGDCQESMSEFGLVRHGGRLGGGGKTAGRIGALIEGSKMGGKLGFEVGCQRYQTRKDGRAQGQNDGRNEDDG